MFTTNFSEHNNIWRHRIGRTLPPNTPRNYRPAFVHSNRWFDRRLRTTLRHNACEPWTVAILELKQREVLRGQEEDQHICLSFIVIFRCFEN